MLRLFSAKSSLLQPLRTLLPNPRVHAPIIHLHNKLFSYKTRLSNPAIDFILNEASEEFKSSKPSPSSSDAPKPQKSFAQNEEDVILSGLRAQISHPWPEWVDLMEILIKGGYFDEIGHPFGSTEMGSKDFNQIRTACLNFARDRFDLMRFLSRVHIQIVAGSGCPSTDRKVVNSGKRLRAHMGVDEGNVCSSCILRGNCERAYVKAREDEGGRTVDVMRFLVAYALDPVTGSVENKPCLNKKVKESVRRLLKEVVGFGAEDLNHEQLTGDANSNWNASTKETASRGLGQISAPLKEGDWTCPKCNFMNFARNVKCLRCDGLFLERLRKLGEEQHHLPLKKGDWICDKCNFLNFAKNTRCLQCKEKPTNRQLNPGEWECESCNYLNFKRNMVCLKCDHKRPKAFNSAALSSQFAAGNDIDSHRARPYFGEEKHWIEKGSDEWEFVDNEGQNYSYSPSKDQGFTDFPVFGGNSELSQNREKQEKWRMEMSEKTKRVAKARVKADEFKHSVIQTGYGLELGVAVHT